jgi:hypothetical protein
MAANAPIRISEEVPSLPYLVVVVSLSLSLSPSLPLSPFLSLLS